MLEELTRHAGWPVLVDYLHTITTMAKHAILNGNVADFERYKAITGELIGIHKAIDAPAVVAGILASEKKRRIEADEPTT